MKCKYKFSADVPVVVEGGYQEKNGLLIPGLKQTRGIQAFGPQGGVLKEEDLTDEICDWLIGRGFEKYLTKKDKKEQ